MTLPPSHPPSASTPRANAPARSRERDLLSDERLRAIIEHAPFGAHSYELTPDGRLLFIG